MEIDNNTIAIIDLLNLIRKPICDKNNGKFESIDELIKIIEIIAIKIKNMGEFQKIYLVTKSFKFNNEISYNDILRIIMWAFCITIPEWNDKICLVLANGTDPYDKEADDRTLFILYNEITKTMKNPVIIISDDHFEDIQMHYLNHVVLNFFWIKKIEKKWNNSYIQSNFKGIFQHENQINIWDYAIVHPL